MSTKHRLSASLPFSQRALLMGQGGFGEDVAAAGEAAAVGVVLASVADGLPPVVDLLRDLPESAGRKLGHAAGEGRGHVEYSGRDFARSRGGQGRRRGDRGSGRGRRSLRGG